MKKKLLSLLLATAMIMGLAACGTAGNTDNSVSGNAEAAQTEWNTDNTIVYGSNDYVPINPAMDEHGEINILIFNGLTAHDADDQVVPGLAESWDYDEDTYTYTFHIRDGIKWDTFAQIPIFIPEFEIQTKIQNIYKNIQQNKLEISTLNNFADTFITTLSSC